MIIIRWISVIGVLNLLFFFFLGGEIGVTVFNVFFWVFFLWFLGVEIGEWAWVRWGLASGFVIDVGVGQVVQWRQRRCGFLAVVGIWF